MVLKAAALAAGLTVAAVTPVVVRTLPGRPVALTPAQRAAGAVEVRRLAVTGTGTRRVSLLAGRTRDGRLCVGSGSFFRCLAPVDAQPAYVLGTFARGGPAWGAIVGLAAPEVGRVEVMLQQGERRELRLQRFAGFPWRAFVFPPTGPNGRLPFDVTLHGAQPGRALSIDMAWVVSTACRASASCSGDSPDAPVGEARPRMEVAKRLALADPRVRRIVEPVTRLVQAPAPWSSCGGKPIGAEIDIDLFRPVTIDGDFPFITFGAEKSGHAYAEGVRHIDADGITELAVGVDLARRKVFSIDPSGDQIHVRASWVVRRATPVGPLDPAVCDSHD